MSGASQIGFRGCLKQQSDGRRYTGGDKIDYAQQELTDDHKQRCCGYTTGLSYLVIPSSVVSSLISNLKA